MDEHRSEPVQQRRYGGGDARTAEEWAEEVYPPENGKPHKDAWKFAAARAYHAWPVGKEMNRDEFEQAVNDANDVVIR